MLCECGCGQDAGVYSATNRRKGRIKGAPKRQVNGHSKKNKHTTHCNRGHLRTAENTWPGGRCKPCSEQRRAEGKNTWPKTENGKRSVKNSGLKTRYGIDQKKHDAILKLQKGCCACCGVTLDSSIKDLIPQVDHVHDKTKRVRGLLCGPCNRGLGQFKDNLENLKNAVRYLEETQ